ncbi:MAG: hypothetical protein BWX99_02442 [Deltaproteobacteria bacterium ADurb.Bin151]|nr:MAG: hypothetical protein BWX99_02442 [Deltaproteobacteria bacterium ADurb.Bin151]
MTELAIIQSSRFMQGVPRVTFRLSGAPDQAYIRFGGPEAPPCLLKAQGSFYELSVMSPELMSPEFRIISVLTKKYKVIIL